MKIEIKILTPLRLTKLFIAASRWLLKYADVLNDLNVYPVPDGDTGTNMSMTLQSVENALIGLQTEPKMEELVDIISEAVLLGARGNSGTILSQIIQGFLDEVRDTEEITVPKAARAFVSAKERAYMAVSQPVEGTILTVIRKVSEAAIAYEGPKDDFIPFLVHLKNAAAEAVDDTPNLLPKLKEAGVDGVILTSTWGTCTRCGATIVKEIERYGIPIVHMATIVTISKSVGANRIVPTVAIPYPVGDASLEKEKEYAVRRDLVERAVDSLATAIEEATFF